MTALSEAEIRARVSEVVLGRFSQSDERRQEALLEFMAVSMPDMAEAAAARVAELVPPVLPELYLRWADMFADRLLATVPRDQIEDMCQGGTEGEAVMALVFLMFMESARMEQQVAEDLAAHGLERSDHDGPGTVAAAYVRARLARMAEVAGRGGPLGRKHD